MLGYYQGSLGAEREEGGRSKVTYHGQGQRSSRRIGHVLVAPPCGKLKTYEIPNMTQFTFVSVILD